MEILFLYRDICKHYIRDAANDRDNLGKCCGKIKMYIVGELQFRINTYKNTFLLCLCIVLKISISSAAYIDRNFEGRSFK